jgi:hypothetical protein
MSNRRRSQRVLLRIPVVVITLGADKQPVPEETHTAVVSAHGGLIYLKTKVSVGQLLTIKNPATREEQPCRVTFLNPLQAGTSEVGIEFMKPSPTFWQVAFPPADWTPSELRMIGDNC